MESNQNPQDPTTRVRAALIEALLGLAQNSQCSAALEAPLHEHEAALLRLLSQVQKEGEIMPFEDHTVKEQDVVVALQFAEQRVATFEVKNRLQQMIDA